MPLPAGTRLGRYEIQESLGAGGMGEVYRARDTRLNRAVAIKVLPAHLHQDDELRRRFEREARTLATVSHPHICPIYDVGHEQGIDYLVMECLAGDTLASRIGKGGLPLAEVLRAGIQIAEALAAAHAHGIVHRDLKPGNVMVTTGGVKLLDFGIARRFAGTAAVTTQYDAALTAEGGIVGTLQYMAPEQLEGSAVDHRADLFAFGALLYEMLTGRAAFARATPSATAAAVIHDQVPPAAGLRPDTPPPLDRLIALCLAKKADDRWNSAHDAALWLRAMQDGPAAAAPPAVRSLWAARLPWAVAAAAIAAAAVLALALLVRPDDEEPVRRVSVIPPPGMSLAVAEAPQISPDGQRLLFVALDVTGNTRLFLRALDQAQAEPLAGTEGAMLPFWAPDSRGIGFFADAWLKVIDAPGATPRDLARASVPRGGTWSEDGTILFVPRPMSVPRRVSVRDGRESVLPQVNLDVGVHRFPQWLPGGGRYLYQEFVPSRGTGRVNVADSEGRTVRALFDAVSHAVYASSGHLLYLRQRDLVARRFDPAAGEPGADAVTLLTGVGLNPITNQPSFSVSNTGVLAYIETTALSQLTRVNRAGERIADASPPGIHNSLCLSASGGTFVADRAGDDGASFDLWHVLRDGETSRLTFDDALDFFPVCSPDGTEVFFASRRRGRALDLYRIAIGEPGTEKVWLETPVSKVPTDWSSDGRWILFSAPADRGDWDVWALPLYGDGVPRPVVATGAEERDATFSPDGRWIAHSSNESGRYEVYIQPFPPSGPRWQASRQGGAQPRWRGDGRELYFVASDGSLMAAGLGRRGAALDIGTPTRLFHPRLASMERYAGTSQYAVSADGSAFTLNRLSEEAERRAITVVLNWPALLPR